MLGQPIQWSHVVILAKTYFRYAIRGGSGLIFLLAFLMVGLTAAGFLIDPLKGQIKRTQEDVAKKSNNKVEIKDKEMLEQVAKIARPAVVWWVGADESKGKTDPLVEHLVVERPPILSAYLLILYTLIPFITCLGAFNQLSGDIGTKGLRYLLLRTERINVIVARFLGTLLFSAAVTLSVILIVVVYIAISFDTDSFAALLAWGLRGWLGAMLLALPYMCMCTLLSAMLDAPIGTLFLCLLATAFPIIVIKIAKSAAGSAIDLAWLDRVTPWGWMYDLLHPSFAKVAASSGIMLAFSFVFAFLAVKWFLRRDL